MDDNKVHGFKISYFSYSVVGITVVCGILFFYFVFKLVSFYDSFLSNITDYTESNKAISELTEASDFLTNQARLFTVKQEKVFLDNYIYEIKELKTREKAVEVITMTHNNDSVYTNTTLAYNESVYIQSIELYAMKLVCLANDIKLEEYDDIFNDVLISDASKKLSKERQLNVAQDFLFSSDYLISKKRFQDYCAKSNRELVYSFLEIKDEVNNFFVNRFSLLILAVSILFISAILFSTFVLLLLIKPIASYTKSILIGEPVKDLGAFELRKLINSYNKLCQNNTEKANVLRQKAEHDFLTGLINRHAFDEIKDVLRSFNEPVAYLLIDVDYFKNINDVYGHQTGDLVLKKISKMLTIQFRKSDYVARVGGDEFAVIMTKFGDNGTEIIKNKIDNMNQCLQTIDDGLPSISLSVGVAFSQEGYIDELVEQADSALYKVKKGGRCNCSFYEEFKKN